MQQADGSRFNWELLPLQILMEWEAEGKEWIMLCYSVWAPPCGMMLFISSVDLHTSVSFLCYLIDIPRSVSKFQQDKDRDKWPQPHVLFCCTSPLSAFLPTRIFIMENLKLTAKDQEYYTTICIQSLQPISN